MEPGVSLSSSMNQKETEILQRFAIKYLSHEELSCWQIWKHVAGELTRCLHRTNSQLLQGGCIQVFENENNVKDHQRDHSRYTANQMFSISRTQASSSNKCLIESQNQSKGEQVDAKNKLRVCEDVMKKSHGEHTESDRAATLPTQPMWPKHERGL